MKVIEREVKDTCEKLSEMNKFKSKIKEAMFSTCNSTDTMRRRSESSDGGLYAIFRLLTSCWKNAVIGWFWSSVDTKWPSPCAKG